jgi:phage portal protein BeeE
MLDNMKDALNHWLTPMFGKHLELSYDKDSISALSPRRDLIWQRIEQATFLTTNEKRAMVGLSPLQGE